MQRKLVTINLAVFGVLLAGSAEVFVSRLSTVVDRQAHEKLNRQWAAMKGYLRIDQNPDTRTIEDQWYYDTDDPEEAAAVSNTRAIYLFTDRNGQVLRASPGYREVGVDSPQEIAGRMREGAESGRTFWQVRRDAKGEAFLIRSGVVFDELHKSPYYVAIGAPLDEDRRTLRTLMWIGLGVIASALVLGWLMGRITPALATR